MESVLKGLKITDILNPRGFRIPNCDKKGFYKKKQVWTSYKHTVGKTVQFYESATPGYFALLNVLQSCFHQGRPAPIPDPTYLNSVTKARTITPIRTS
jgi:hypothetical protein